MERWKQRSYNLSNTKSQLGLCESLHAQCEKSAAIACSSHYWLHRQATCVVTQGHTTKCPELDLMLCPSFLRILYNFWTHGSLIYLAGRASPACLPNLDSQIDNLFRRLQNLAVEKNTPPTHTHARTCIWWNTQDTKLKGTPWIDQDSSQFPYRKVHTLDKSSLQPHTHKHTDSNNILVPHTLIWTRSQQPPHNEEKKISKLEESYQYIQTEKKELLDTGKKCEYLIHELKGHIATYW